jgi:hypothetical protein
LAGNWLSSKVINHGQDQLNERNRVMKSDLREPQASGRSRYGKNPGGTAADTEMDNDEMMKRMEEAGEPGPAHRALDDLLGEWRAEVKCWMDPNGEPQVTQGRATVRWRFDGRFIEEEFHGEMMGRPFVGQTLMGYDNTKQKFTSLWIADTATSMFFSEGKGDARNRVITLEGKASCAATGRTDLPMRTVLRLLSSDKHVLEMFDGSKGDAKTMEITYTRAD